ncbi:MAG: hypothetical protein HKM24_03970 [Gammaproteobacteria bacterium]|nr:hypothetical protein [Gammaproteobacteria bacterium]
MSQERRDNPPASTVELHQLAQTDIEDYITKERRDLEKKRLVNVKQQRSLWRWTVGICILLNLVFLALAIIGLD